VEPYYGPVASPGYLRFPHIADDIVVFVAADGVWLAPLSGGRAWPFTTDEAQADARWHTGGLGQRQGWRRGNLLRRHWLRQRARAHRRNADHRKLENHGVDPDVEVIVSPDDWAAQRDTQLETAVRLVPRESKAPGLMR
jgi:hypothetical protein